MSQDMEQLYRQRLNRYVTAMGNKTPDRVPVRVFAAEFAARYAGFTCQQVTHDYNFAYEATRKCAADYGWDATVGNMVYVWTGLTQALGLRYYGVPGVDVSPDTGFQYREPPEGKAFMRPEEYDHLIEDPTDFLFSVWLPRVSTEISAPGKEATFRSHVALVKGGMAMWNYFVTLGHQGEALRRESGTVSAISGIFKAPMDILADKLRGYLGLTMDLMERPEKVLAACRALMPHLLYVALSGADSQHYVPIGFWMHRGCVPFISHEHFSEIYWPTLKPIVEHTWKAGHQMLFYAEGNWDAHLEAFAELPAGSIVYHVDRGDIFRARAILGDKFCLSGGVPNYLLAYGTPEEVRDTCRRIIEGVADKGGYVMDASAIIQNDAKPENVRAMTESAWEFGNYGKPADDTLPPPFMAPTDFQPTPLPEIKLVTPPGVCTPWSTKRQELDHLLGDESILERVWNEVEGFAYAFIWHCLLSF